MLCSFQRCFLNSTMHSVEKSLFIHVRMVSTMYRAPPISAASRTSGTMPKLWILLHAYCWIWSSCSPSSSRRSPSSISPMPTIDYYDFDVTQSDCSWILQRPGMAIPRKLYDTDCVSNGVSIDQGVQSVEMAPRVASQQVQPQTAPQRRLYSVPAPTQVSSRVESFTAHSKYAAIANSVRSP